MKLIGINGFKRSGKGTVAEIIEAIVADDDARVKSIGFADKLKLLAARTLGHRDVGELQAVALMDEFKENGYVVTSGGTPLTITGRQYLQNIGNEARDIFGDTFWIDQVLPNPILHEGWERPGIELVQARYPEADYVLVTDVRYPNEAERVKALGGMVWEVLRPGTASDGHASEQPLPEHLIDWQIVNDGSFKLLRDRVFLAHQEASEPVHA
jgi:hypothetical protein